MTTRSIRPPSSSTGSRSLSPARASSSTIAGSQRRPNSAANRNPPKPYGSPALWNGSPNRTNPNEPSPLRRLLSLIETNELRPATKLIFAGGPRLRIPFAPPVCPSQQGPADDVGQRRGLCRRSGPGSGREKAEQRRPAGEGPWFESIFLQRRVSELSVPNELNCVQTLCRRELTRELRGRATASSIGYNRN